MNYIKDNPKQNSANNLSQDVACQLVKKALAVRNHAYAPHSGFWVGAALLGYDGKIFTGCNVENSSYGATICAERGAILAGVAGGAVSPAMPIKAIAVVGGKKGDSLGFCLPCGICLQVLAEFAVWDECKIILAESPDGVEVSALKEYLLKDLLPHGFKL